MGIYGRRIGGGFLGRRFGRQVQANRGNTPAGGTAVVSGQVQQLAQRLANDIIRQRDFASRRARLGRIYTNFRFPEDALENQIETVTRGLFANNTGSLVDMYLNSNLTATQKSYYEEVWSAGDPASTATANPELSLAYGHFAGSGSADTTGNLNNDTPSRAIYKQYAQILLPPNDKKFTFNGVDSDSIYILNFNRARYREKLDPGNFELTLAQLSGSIGPGFLNSGHTGSAIVLAGDNNYRQIIDDSSIVSPLVGEAGLVYNLVSGSIDEGTSIHVHPTTGAPVYYGLLYPQHGIAVLNGNALDQTFHAANAGVNFGTVTGSGVAGDNVLKLFRSLSGSDNLTPAGTNGGIQARSSEQVKSTYYFVRVLNGEYNYSNNPSFVTGSLGQLAFSTFINDPQAYITTVGLYNDRKELLATAKLSQPLLKNFTREALIKVKLDF
jgi:hypothetical protein